MKKYVLNDSYEGSTFYSVEDNGKEWFEVKCKGMILKKFDDYEQANSFFQRWAPEIEKEIRLFDK